MRQKIQQAPQVAQPFLRMYSASCCTALMWLWSFVVTMRKVFTIISSYSCIEHYMFRPNWPSSDVQVVTVKDSAVHCKSVFSPPYWSSLRLLWLYGLPSVFIWVSLGFSWLLLFLYDTRPTQQNSRLSKNNQGSCIQQTAKRRRATT
jgi:hypothetical protein